MTICPAIGCEHLNKTVLRPRDVLLPLTQGEDTYQPLTAVEQTVIDLSIPANFLLPFTQI